MLTDDEIKALPAHQIAELVTRLLSAEARVKVLEDALISVEEYWNGSTTEGAMADALNVITTRARKALQEQSK
jgi:hypothetical protein